jgi:hypothetical protein
MICSHLFCTGIISTGDDQSLPINRIDKLHERPSEAGRRRIAIRMVPFNIGDHCHFGTQPQEHVVIFVGLDDEIGCGAGCGIAEPGQSGYR